MIMAFVEMHDGTPTPDSEGVLAAVRDLADRRAVPAGAIAVGEAGELPGRLEKHGIARLYLVQHAALDASSSQLCGDAVAELITQVRPEGVLAPTSLHATEVLARAAARLRVPLATQCVAVRPGDPWEVTRERGGGILLEDAELDAPVALCTVTPAAVPVAEEVTPADGEVDVQRFTPALDTTARHACLVDRRRRAAGMTLATAPVVVSGGRGVGSAEGYAVLEELAGLLGGAVGCSRVATNNGWRPHRDQVGLTGTRITPDLYIACGISGATQHWVGCMGARTILAINTDPEAPMVTRAHYAVIGDVHAVLPAVIEELRTRTGREPPAPTRRAS